MSIQKDIDKIIRLYFNKHFQPKRKELFSRWFRSTEFSKEKETSIKKVWSEIPLLSASEDTLKEWEILKQQINRSNQKSEVKAVVTLFRPLFRYASLLLIAILTSILIYQKFSQEEPVLELAKVFTKYGENEYITLPDGSGVWLDSGSLLIYPKDFKYQKDRSVYLVGEANFCVHKDESKPFKVKAGNMVVEALGTQFTVQSYQNSTTISVLLEEGSVAVAMNDLGIVKTLKPNEQIVYNSEERSYDINLVDVFLYKSKREGYQIYENIGFKELMFSLERKYNVSIQYINSKYEREKYTVKFTPEEGIEDVLEILHHLIGINYKIDKTAIYIN